jgi:hypothetical protein
MRTGVLIAALSVSVLLAGVVPLTAADVAGPIGIAPPEPAVVIPGCRAAWACGPRGCAWEPLCRRKAAQRYYGYPLYGAYGPYGGTGYWGAYTLSGWGR